MKKLLLLIVVTLFGLTACSFDFQFGDTENESVVNSANSSEETPEEVEEVEAAEPIENEDGEVVIDIPADAFEGMTSDDVVAYFEMDGITDVTVNDDGSYTLKMSLAEQAEILGDLRMAIQGDMDEITEAMAPAFIKKITTNDLMTELHVNIDRNLYEGDMEGFVLDDFAMYALNYQMLAGVDMNDSDFDIVLFDDVTGDEFERWSARDE